MKVFGESPERPDGFLITIRDDRATCIVAPISIAAAAG
jgi:hypothetical protein